MKTAQQQCQEDPSHENITAELVAAENYKHTHHCYLSFLKQKAKAHWLKEGDDNTRAFHQSIKSRQIKGRIHGITDEYGNWVEDPPAISKAFLSFYQNLLGTALATRTNIKKKVISMGKCLTEQHQKSLDLRFSKEEIKQVVFSIPDDKAPGGDGYGSQFFKHCWHLIGDDFVSAIQDFFSHGKLLREVNATILTLVPKVKCPRNVGDYRPIACCNVIYKCITKLICTKLSLILPDIVSLNQGAFVQGRHIVDNILVCQDLMRCYRPSSLVKGCMLKIDLKKAYDSIDWGFLKDLLSALHFPEKFIAIVMECISSPKFSLNLNGGLHGYFAGCRGLRQGDPMSPLLFVLVMDYFTRLMQYVGMKKEFKFHNRCRGLKLNHLCFADDLMVFSHGDAHSVHLLLQALKLFSNSTGLMANLNKTEVFTCGAVDDKLQKVISGFHRGKLPMRYLGVPICAYKMKAQECEVLVDKMISRIRTWSTRNFSFAGRLQLVNSVLMSVQVYWAQSFILPRSIIQKVSSICKSYLWHGCADSGRPGYIAWDKVCTPKKAGGLGLRHPNLWNIAAIAKHVWSIAAQKEDLWVKWVHSVYIKGKSWMEYNAPHYASWVWKAICKTKDIMKKGFLTQGWLHGGYSIKKGYEWLGGDAHKVSWAPAIWNRLSLPKHRLILWLAIQGRLQTRAKLKSLGIIVEDECLLCGVHSETHEHLFYQCHYSRTVLQKMMLWVGCHSKKTDLTSLMLWILNRFPGTRFRRQVLMVVAAAVVYGIWQIRNDALWNSKVQLPDYLVKCLQDIVKLRILPLVGKKVSLVDRMWLHSKQNNPQS